MPRRLVTIDGVVQGVGFRPFVFRLADRLGLSGFVRNDGGKVVVEVEGKDSQLDSFLSQLSCESPPLARILDLQSIAIPETSHRGFSIVESESSATDVALMAPDVVTCDRCLAELMDRGDRRFGYPFLNCTNCGPRLTIVTQAPYDRVRTTMARFAMCPACQQEYENPVDRRFHAQPTACSACGPQLALLDATGRVIETDEPLESAANRLLEGMIAAIKGLGGYHLVCDARSDRAVAELRRRKHRDARPFAIMVRDLGTAREVCEISEQEKMALTCPAGPIVLLRRRSDDIAEAVAPNNPFLGVMLPNTPLHYLLLRAVGNIPLVMTSGNRGDEPIAYDDERHLPQLVGLADLFLIHNRQINVRCDDSVVRIVSERLLPIRRSRGYAPAPIRLPMSCPAAILAVGGQLKSTFALGRDRQAIVSHHLGDLHHYEAYRAYDEAVAQYERLFAIEPAIIAHDLHPDYVTTGYAQSRERPAARIAVQHHHAHLASCLAENGLNERAIGVIFDGAGYGPDGAVWGGEFLIGDYQGYCRAAHLRYVPMPGGEQAIREPWRMAVAHLSEAGLTHEASGADISLKEIGMVRQMMRHRFNAPLTSSAGRLFDAVAAIIGLRSHASFEGQAAMDLEWLATETAPCGGYPYSLAEADGVDSSQPAFEIDTRPLIAGVAADVRAGQSAAQIARRFHSTLVEMIASVCYRLREQTGLELVALSGGVFANALLLAESAALLEKQDFRVCRHESVPPNDGGLCLGQLAVAAANYSRDNATGRHSAVTA